MVEAVVFDWGGTLTPWITMDFRAGWETYTSILHAEDPELARSVAEALATADTGRWAAVKHGAKAFHLGEVLADAAIDTSSELHGQALEAYREFWVQATHTDPEAAPMLSALKEQGIKLGVLSSTMWPGEWHEDWLRRDEVLHFFDGVTWSSDLEFTKPHPSAFEAALAAVGATDPARCVYVGDRPYDDISGAKALGMRAVLVPHSDIPVDQQVPVDVAPDGVIQRLSELPELIRHW